MSGESKMQTYDNLAQFGPYLFGHEFYSDEQVFKVLACRKNIERYFESFYLEDSFGRGRWYKDMKPPKPPAKIKLRFH